MKKLLYLTAVTALALTACDKKDEPQPKFKIVELVFSSYASRCTTIEDVQEVLTNGADSVYLVSAEDFDRSQVIRNHINLARDGALKMTALSPKVRGKGVINPTVEVAANVHSEVPGELESCGFKYIPGYVKPK